MSRLSKMQPILELAERKEEDAAKNLGLGQQKLEKAKIALVNLQTYRAGYAARFETWGKDGLPVQQLTEYRAFLSKINKAVSEQEQAITRAEDELERLRAAWADAHKHLLGIRKLVEKLTHTELMKSQKREQSEQDDRSANRREGLGGKSLLSIFL